MYTVTLRTLARENGNLINFSDKIVCRIDKVDSKTLKALRDGLSCFGAIKFRKLINLTNGRFEITTDDDNIRVFLEYIPTIDEMVGEYEYYCAIYE